MEWASTGELLKDFRSIKLPKDKRVWIDRLRAYFEQHGAIPNDERFKLTKVYRRYSRQFKELYESRERAKCTNGLRAMGMTPVEAARRVKERERQQAEKAADLGI